MFMSFKDYSLIEYVDPSFKLELPPIVRISLIDSPPKLYEVNHYR